MTLRPSRPALALAAKLSILGVVLAGCSGSSSRGGGGAPPVIGPPVDDVLLYPFRGPKSVLLIIANFKDGKPLFTSTAESENHVRSIRDDVINAFDVNSYGELSLTIDYTWPPVFINKTADEYLPATALVHVRADAIAAAKKAGYDVDSYDREALFCEKVWPSGARGWIRTAWMPHKLRWVLVHEIGHTLSRGHANFWDGDPTDALRIKEDMESVDYGDIFDPMGSGTLWNRMLISNPWFKYRAGWLPGADIVTVEQSGTYTLTSLENPNAAEGPTALRIRRDSMTDYWLMFRSTEPLVNDGPLILLASTNPYDPLHLLDMNRGVEANEVEDASLAPGQTFDDSAKAGITVTNLTQPGDAFVTVDITVDAARQSSLDIPPRIEVLSPPRDQGPVSGIVTFEVASSDLDVNVDNGAGIQKVTLNIFLPTNDTKPSIARQEFSAPPYRMTVDLSTAQDTYYYFEVTSEATDGGVNQIWFRVIVDNYTATLP